MSTYLYNKLSNRCLIVNKKTNTVLLNVYLEDIAVRFHFMSNNREMTRNNCKLVIFSNYIRDNKTVANSAYNHKLEFMKLHSNVFLSDRANWPRPIKKSHFNLTKHTNLKLCN